MECTTQCITQCITRRLAGAVPRGDRLLHARHRGRDWPRRQAGGIAPRLAPTRMLVPFPHACSYCFYGRRSGAGAAEGNSGDAAARVHHVRHRRRAALAQDEGATHYIVHYTVHYIVHYTDVELLSLKMKAPPTPRTTLLHSCTAHPSLRIPHLPPPTHIRRW